MIDTSTIRVTSRTALKLSCLQACGNDLDRATALYRYLADDLGELPAVDPPAASTLERVRMGADDVLGWIGGHRDEIAEGLRLLKGLRPAVTLPTAPSVASLAEIPKP